MLGTQSPTLQMMTLTTLGERGLNARNGIPFPTGKILLIFLKSRYSPTVAEKSGAIHYYSKPAGTKRDFLCAQCVEYRSQPMFDRHVCLPDMPSRPLPPTITTNQGRETDIQVDMEEGVFIDDSSTSRDNVITENDVE